MSEHNETKAGAERGRRRKRDWHTEGRRDEAAYGEGVANRGWVSTVKEKERQSGEEGRGKPGRNRGLAHRLRVQSTVLR